MSHLKVLSRGAPWSSHDSLWVLGEVVSPIITQVFLLGKLSNLPQSGPNANIRLVPTKTYRVPSVTLLRSRPLHLELCIYLTYTCLSLLRYDSASLEQLGRHYCVTSPRGEYAPDAYGYQHYPAAYEPPHQPPPFKVRQLFWWFCGLVSEVRRSSPISPDAER